MQFIGCKFYVQLVICRTYSFLRAAEFEAEPQNLLFCGILIFRGILRNLAEVEK